MKETFNEKLVAYLTLLSGLSISAIAIYYSVLGLVAIFAAAAIPVIVMGVVLEVSKIIATLWLKQNWKHAPRLIKTYLIIAVFILMCVTSMGIFGFLSKSHNDQTLNSGNNRIQLVELNRQIQIEKRNIEDATRVIAQLDQAVQALTDAQRIRGRDGAIAVRKNQAQERDNLNSIISESNKKINLLEQEKLPLEQQRLNIEAEVGPIKYIAAFIYGNTPNKDILEKAVTWIIILLIIVFDPLAIVLLLASQYSFQNFRQTTILNTNDNTIKSISEKVDPFMTNESLIKQDEFDYSKHTYLDKGFKYPENFKREAPVVYTNNAIVENDTVNETSLTKISMDNETYEKLDDIKKKEILNYWANMVRSKRKSMSEVPRHILLEVRALV